MFIWQSAWIYLSETTKAAARDSERVSSHAVSGDSDAAAAVAVAPILDDSRH